MKALHEMTLNEQTLMPKDWIQRRLARLVNHTGRGGGVFKPTVSLVDISKWFGVHYDLIRHMEGGRIPVSDDWQIKLSQFFYLLDMGYIEVRVKGRHKTWARATPTVPPCKSPMPRVDFAAPKLKLKFD